MRGDDSDIWSAYWRTAPRDGCTAGLPPAVAAAIAARWRTAFAACRDATLLDIGTGGGAVLAHALASGLPADHLTGVDHAQVAPAIGGVVMHTGLDAAALPFEEDSFDIVVSQFGIEYAGWRAALGEVARVARKSLLLLVHHRDSALVRHGREQAAQAHMLLRDEALATALRAEDPQAAGRSIAALRPAADNHGLLDQLAEATATVAAMRAGGEAPDAAIDHIIAELLAHAARMTAMADAALDDAAFAEAAALLRGAGYAVTLEPQRAAGDALVAMWIAADRINSHAMESQA
ncbi:class I SAM-dependent methyltransferase [Sphingomonas baiyangensis]|nr:class I SAM-dependent methyltransferase [Sphingomonas baiyangensis]